MSVLEPENARAASESTSAVSQLPGFEGWTIVPAPAEVSSQPPMLVSPDGHTAVRQDLAQAIAACRTALVGGEPGSGKNGLLARVASYIADDAQAADGPGRG
jgi:hypothetical protein